MEALREMKDKEYDLAIVDPPYGIDILNMGGQPASSRFVNHKRGDWDKQKPDKKYFDEVMRISKNYVIWGANYFCEYLKPTMGWIFWYKGQDDFTFSDGELAATSFNVKIRYVLISRGEISKEQRIHKTQKPVKLYEWLLHNYAKEGDKILDTHLGSGSIAIACYNMGFSLDGFEIDKDYYEGAVKRLEIHKRQQVLFLPNEIFANNKQTL